MGLTSIQKRKRIKQGIRKKLSGTAEKPRLSIFRSNKAVYAQLIDDLAGNTIVAASTKETGATGTKVEQSKQVGVLLADKAKQHNIENVVFDRNGYQYHGRVKALADGARENGLKF